MSKPADEVQSNSRPFGFAPLMICLCLPVVLVIAILFLSPNFKQGEPGTVRTNPLGADFLQEWVGAHVASSDQRDQLYDLEHFKKVQHDSELVGFQWPEKDFFPVVYPPFYYQALGPIAKVSYPTAIKVFAVLSALAVSLAGWLMFQFYEPSRRSVAVGVVAALFFVPLLTCFSMGQKSTFLLFILTATFLLLHQQKPFAGGLAFGLIAFKPHLGILIGVTMLLKRQWWFAAGALVTVGLLVGTSYAFNSQLWSDYLQVVLGMNDYVESGGYLVYDSHSLWGATELTLSKFNAPGWPVKVVAGLLAVGVAFLVWRIMRGDVETSSRRFALQFSALVFATVMLNPHFYTYDLTILLLPMLLIGVSGNRPAAGSFQMLGFVLAGLFVFAGMFSQFAEATNVQFSIPLMVGGMILIARVTDEVDSIAG